MLRLDSDMCPAEKLLNHLVGAERESFVEEMKPQVHSLKKVSTGRQVAAVDRLMTAMATPTPPRSGSTPENDGAGQAPPALQVDVSSAAPTPVLTMAPNTPQSSSPPSTNASAADEPVDDSGKAKESNSDTESLCADMGGVAV